MPARSVAPKCFDPQVPNTRIGKQLAPLLRESRQRVADGFDALAVDPIKIECARNALADARDLYHDGRNDDAVELLVTWLDQGELDPEQPMCAELVDVQQAMAALGCWLCNSLATDHITHRRVCRAFGLTRTCERWLTLRDATSPSQESAAMWLRLRYDCALNAAELAQSSRDLSEAISKLRQCERLQNDMGHLPSPETVHLCLAETLLQAKRCADAIPAAQRAVELLRLQLEGGDKTKLYSMVFALSLEQAAFCLVASGAEAGVPPLRSLRCLREAEDSMRKLSSLLFAEKNNDCTVLAETDSSELASSSVANACQAILEQMRCVHNELNKLSSRVQNGTTGS